MKHIFCCVRHGIIFELMNFLSLGCNRLSNDHLCLFYGLRYNFLCFFLDSLLIFLVIQGSCCLTDFVCGIIAIQSSHSAL